MEDSQVDDDVSDASGEDEPKWNQLFSALDSMLEKDKELAKLKSSQLLKVQTAETVFTDEEPGLAELLNASYVPPNIDNVLRYNQGCKNVLLEMEKRLQELLAENRKKQEELEDSIRYSIRVDDDDDSSTNIKIKCVGMPYFKDRDGFLAPYNDDVKKKIANREPLTQNLFPKGAVKKDYCGKLEKLVIEQVRESRRIKLEKKKFDLLEKNSEDLDGVEAIEQEIEEIQNKPSHLLNVNASEVDWMAISTKIGEYSYRECEAKWILECDPRLNKSEWKTSELDQLKKLAQKYKHQDWDLIADELNTNRTGYQCCKKYFTMNSCNEGKWTAEEDGKLLELIKKYQIKNEIPWQKIAWYFDSRTKRQCRERYLYGLSVTKKGAFDSKEDKLLVSSLKKCNNFSEIAKKVPGRSVKQIRARYDYLVGTHMDPFTEAEQDLLIKLVSQHSKDWKLISKFFENRTPLQCRKQWSLIQNDVRVEIVSDDDSDWEDFTLHYQCHLPAEAIKDTEESPTKKKFEQINLGRPPLDLISKSEAYNKFFKYLKTCHEFSFGPKSKIFKNEEEEKKSATKMRLIMAMLGTDPGDLSSKLEEMDVIEDADFNTEDRTLLSRLAEENEENPTASLIFKNLIPPNYTTLVGLRSLLLGHKIIKEISGQNVPETSTITNPIRNEDRLLFRDAKMRFKNRLKSLFSLPIICSFTNPIPTEKILLPKTKKSKPRSKQKTKKLCKKMAEKKQLSSSKKPTVSPLEESPKVKSAAPVGKKRGRPTREETMKKKLEKARLEAQEIDDPMASATE